MLSTTIDAVKAILRSDPSISVVERNLLLSALRSGANPPKGETTSERVRRILRRHEGASRLGVSLRTFDKLCKQGALKKYVLPGRTRAAGVLECDLNALLMAERK